MNPMHSLRGCLQLGAAILLLSSAVHAAESELLLAGGDEMFIVDAKAAESGKADKLWRWSGTDAPDLPDEARRDFVHLDECKPVDGGSKILVCASNGGCALIERATKKILWRAHVTNAHSLALLPHDRVVVASSLSGDHLLVFDLNGPPQPVFKTPLRSAHGVAWDEQRHCLWALNFEELRSYTLDHWDSDKPELKLKSSHTLSDKDGHDLRPVPASNELILTTEHTVQLFDRDQLTFKPHPLLGPEPNLKSVDIHPKSGRIVLSNWSAVVRLLNPEGTIKFNDAHPYKVRWLEASQPK